MSTRTIIRIGDLGRVVTGRTPPSTEMEHFRGNIPFLTPSDIDGFNRTVRTERSVSSDWDRQQGRISLPPRSICVVCIGATIGKVCFTSTQSQSNQQINSIIADETRFDALFIYYLLRLMGDELRQRAAGAATPILNKSAFCGIEIGVPTRPAQQRIASILGAYDDLIEVNRRRIAILEEMARWIYEELCIRNSDEWPTKRLDDLIDVDPTTRVPRDGPKPFIPMTSVQNSSMLITAIERRDGNSGSKFINGDTLLARITPCLENGKTGYVDFLTPEEPVGFGSTEFIVMRGRSVPPEFVQLLARSESFRAHAIASMSGATGRQRVRRESIEQYPIAVPPAHHLETLVRSGRPIFALARTLAEQIVNLTAQRDLLLPKLISGEIDVSEAPAIAEAAE
ncbi:MAG: restriction endonuclease subunit S [Labrys sp. (in: a-proteobacteria)]